jgi:hypothetical protein
LLKRVIVLVLLLSCLLLFLLQIFKITRCKCCCLSIFLFIWTLTIPLRPKQSCLFTCLPCILNVNLLAESNLLCILMKLIIFSPCLHSLWPISLPWFLYQLPSCLSRKASIQVVLTISWSWDRFLDILGFLVATGLELLR